MVKKVIKIKELDGLAAAFRSRFLRDWDGQPIKLLYVRDGYNQFFEEQGFVNLDSPLMIWQRNYIRGKLNDFESKYEDESEIAFHIRLWRHGKGVEVVTELEARTGRTMWFGRKFKKRVTNERRVIQQLEVRAIKEGVSDDDYDRIKGSRKLLDIFEEGVSAHANSLSRWIDDMYRGYAEEVTNSITSRRQRSEERARGRSLPRERFPRDESRDDDRLQ